MIFIGCNFESRASQVGLHKQKKDTASAKEGKVSLRCRGRRSQGFLYAVSLLFFSLLCTELSFSEFALLTEEDVKSLTVACKKSCDLDPLPSSILSIHLDHLLPVITETINLSLKTGRFADEWKNALVHALLKKPGFELVNKNFRPISNLQFTSKVTEKAVAIQLQAHMLTNGLFPEMQSAYREHHSTETALLKVKNDILMNMDMGHVTLLVVLALSAAFDT